MNPSPLFSSYDYYTNHAFQHCHRNWERYAGAFSQVVLEGETEVMNFVVLNEWREILMRDWYEYAKEWWFKNRNENKWRVNLE